MITKVSVLKKYAKENKWLLLLDAKRKEYLDEYIWILPNGEIVIASYCKDGHISQINDELNIGKRNE